MNPKGVISLVKNHRVITEKGHCVGNFHMDVTAPAQKYIMGFDVRKNLFLGTRSCDVPMKGPLSSLSKVIYSAIYIPEN